MFNIELIDRRIVFNCEFELKDEIKALGAKWNKPVERKWSMGSKNIPIDLVRFVDKHNLDVDPQLEDRFYAIRRSIDSSDKSLEFYKNLATNNLESVLNQKTLSGKTLMHHQKEFVHKFVENEFNIVNSLFIGGGKTYSSLVAAGLLGIKLVLILPPSLMDNWKDELIDVNLSGEIYSHAKIPEFIEGEFVLICDECHLYQSPTSQRSKAMLNLALSPNCVGTIMITGTLYKNAQPRNALAPLKAIKHEVAKDDTNYYLTYCNAGPTKWSKFDTSGSSNLDELYKKTKDAIFTRERSKCVDLPPFTRLFKDVELDNKQLKVYHDSLRKLKADYYRRLNSGEIKTGGEHMVFLSHARRCSSMAKIPYTLELVEEIVAGKSQVILFSWWKEVLNELAKKLNCRTITGDTAQKDRQPYVDEFQEGKKKVICNTFGAGGVGLNMQAADYLILIDRSYVPADYEQAEGRSMRIGQTKPVSSLWLNFSHTETDRIIDQIILEKQERIDLVMRGKRKTFKRLDTFESLAPDLLGSLFDFE